MVSQVEPMIVKEEKFVKKTHERHETHTSSFVSPCFFFTLRKEAQKIRNLQTKKYPGTDSIGVGAEVRFHSEVLTFSPKCGTHTCRPYKTQPPSGLEPLT